MTARPSKKTPAETTTPAATPRPRRRTAAERQAATATTTTATTTTEAAATEAAPAETPAPRPRKATKAPAAKAVAVKTPAVVPQPKPRKAAKATAAPETPQEEPPFAVGDYAKPIEAQTADETVPGVVTDATLTEGGWMIEVTWADHDRLLLAAELEAVTADDARVILSQPIWTVVGLIDSEANGGDGELHIAGVFRGVPFRNDGEEVDATSGADGQHVAMAFDETETVDGRWFRFAHRVYAATAEIAEETAWHYEQAMRPSANPA